MNLLDQLKNAADRNGDGRLNKDDLEALKDGSNNEILDKMKDMADQNNDGKVSFDDVKDFNLGGAIGDLKNKFM